MRIIHSFWSKPSIDQTSDSLDNRLNGGWLTFRHHYYSWALSCLRAKKIYKDIHLVTDDLGRDILIDRLKLPYSQVSLRLNDLANYSSDCWALGKIYAYAGEEGPFLHIDSDVFLWRPISESLLSSPLVSQNIEYNHNYYGEALKEMRKHNFEFPAFISSLNYANIISSNAGILGGSNTGFFKELNSEVFSFLDKNKSKLSLMVNPSIVNVVFEQLFFTCLAEKLGLPVNYLFGENDVSGNKVIPFERIPLTEGYAHISGRSAKNSFLIANKVELFLMYEFPEFYNQLNCILDDFRY